MPRVGFELTTLLFKRAKTVHALDPAATVNDPNVEYIKKKYNILRCLCIKCTHNYFKNNFTIRIQSFYLKSSTPNSSKTRTYKYLKLVRIIEVALYKKYMT
jgi:hypothetical protein